MSVAKLRDFVDFARTNAQKHTTKKWRGSYLHCRNADYVLFCIFLLLKKPQIAARSHSSLAAHVRRRCAFWTQRVQRSQMASIKPATSCNTTTFLFYFCCNQKKRCFCLSFLFITFKSRVPGLCFLYYFIFYSPHPSFPQDFHSFCQRYRRLSAGRSHLVPIYSIEC